MRTTLHSTVATSIAGVVMVAVTSVSAARDPEPARKQTPVVSPTKPGTQKSTVSHPEWKILFDGTSLDAWRGYKNTPIPSGWHIVDGTLSKEKPVTDIVTKDEFGDFELEIEWRIGRAGNSGIFYRGGEDAEHIYWTGTEYQLLDDLEAEDNKSRLTCAGAAYGLYPSPPGHLKPVGDWNKTRILAKGAHVEHWLNDFKLVEYELWSPDWEAKVKASKFAVWPNYGRLKTGHIALQGDHNGVLAFRNIRVREIH